MGQVPHAEFMTARVYDSWVHEQDVRRALDRPGGSGNAASAISLGRIQDAMPFVVGKKAGCAEGTAVRFDVSGPGDDARAFTIAVEGGRARPVADERRTGGHRSPFRASTSRASAVAGPLQRRWRRTAASAWTATSRWGWPCSVP